MSDPVYGKELQQQWSEKFPSTLSGLFAFYQCLCTIAIIGCEVGSILIDLFNDTIYVGIWASIFFMIAWISQAAAVSCRRTQKCVTFTLIMQCIALFFAACVITFDAYVLIVPTTCLFPLSLCNSTAPLRGIFYSKNNVDNIKIPLIKGQLATAAILFAFSIDYIIMHVVTRMRIEKGEKSIFKTPNRGVSVLPVDPVNVRSIKSADPSDLITKKNTTNLSWMEPTRLSTWSVESIDKIPIKI